MELKVLKSFKCFNVKKHVKNENENPNPNPNPNPNQTSHPNHGMNLENCRRVGLQRLGDSFGDGVPPAEFSYSKQTILYMRSNVKLGDVLLSVGPKGREEEIRTFKFPLMAASPVFRQLFVERWERKNGLDDGSEIVRLPNVEATAFKNFLNILLSHEMNPEILGTFSLTLTDIFDVMAICRKYIVPEMEEICEDYLRKNKTVENCIFIFENIEGLVDKQLQTETLNYIVEHYNQIVERDEFLRTSKRTLIRILRHPRLHMNELAIFKSVFIWAKYQCASQGLEPSGENLRNALGETLFLIRFPLLTPRNFAVYVRSKNILLQQEALDLLTYLSLSPEDKKTISLDYLRFRTNRRPREPTQIMQFYTNSQIDYEANPVICIANEKSCRIRCDTSCKGVRIYSFGFTGPMEPDTSYKAKVSIYDEHWMSLGSSSTTVITKGKTVFHVWLRQPRNFEPNAWYYVNYQLEGGDTGSVSYTNGEEISICHDDEIAFTLSQEYQDLQLVELKFEKLKDMEPEEDPYPPSLGIGGEFSREDGPCILPDDDGASQAQGDGGETVASGDNPPEPTEDHGGESEEQED